MSDKKVLQVGSFMIGLAILLRLTLGVWAPVLESGQPIQPGQIFLFLQTGRVICLPAAPPPQEDTPLPSETPSPTIAVFSQTDRELIQMRNSSDKKADVSTALLTELQWDLYANQPTVLILHSHGSESYEYTGEYQETTAYRTLNTDYNMVSIGDQLANKLEQAGIRVIHDRTLYDVPSYNDAYVNARKAIQQHLAENPSICLVLDLHRDASGDVQNQMRTKATVDGTAAAQIMFVVGTNGTGLKHPDWKENLALALKLQVQMERLAPGICRKLNLRGQRFNQDTSPGALLVEVGAAGNTHDEALAAAEQLAEAIAALALGTQ